MLNCATKIRSISHPNLNWIFCYANSSNPLSHQLSVSRAQARALSRVLSILLLFLPRSGSRTFGHKDFSVVSCFLFLVSARRSKSYQPKLNLTFGLAPLASASNQSSIWPEFKQKPSSRRDTYAYLRLPLIHTVYSIAFF